MQPAIRLSHVHKSFGDVQPVHWKFWQRRPAARPARLVINDISFDIRPGEKVALLGRNGAGKSTLLKMISRILQPDSGSIEVVGRVASLLELGIGFHPELTGAENIYFYGAVMGMTRSEVDTIFADICAFADIGDYINQPVKVYSSGMYQRLAFASAFAVQPDILIADEGLSVGDQAFQQKCLDRIVELTQSGTTILVVAHSISAILRITDRGIWLEDGRVHQDGSIHEVAEAYSQHMATVAMPPHGASTATNTLSGPYIATTPSLRIPYTAIVSGLVDDAWDRNQPLVVEAKLEVGQPVWRARMSLRFVSASENVVVWERDYIHEAVHEFTAGVHTLRFTIPACELRPSLYRVAVLGFDEHGLYRLIANGMLFLRVVDPLQIQQQQAVFVSKDITLEICS